MNWSPRSARRRRRRWRAPRRSRAGAGRAPVGRRRPSEAGVPAVAGGRRAGGRQLGILVLDSGGVSFLAQRSRAAVALLAALRRDGLWPALVPSAVLVECLTG